MAERLRAAADLARAREQDAAIRERQARAIADVAHALNASPDLDAVLRTAMEAVRGLVRADSARIAIVDDAGRLVLRYSTDANTAMPPGFVIERGHGMGGLAWATGEPVRTDDFAADPRFSSDRYVPIARRDGIVSCMVVPIVSAGAVVGVIYANNFTPRPFSATDQEALVILADHAAVALQKARLLARESEARAARRGGEPRQGRVPRHARPRAAQPAVRDRHAVARARADGAPSDARPGAPARSSRARPRTWPAWSTTCSTSPA